MNKRFVSLIAALLAVIMLIPSVALADTVTLTFGTVAKTTINYADYQAIKGGTFAALTAPTISLTGGLVEGEIAWKSYQNDVISMDADPVPFDAETAVAVPELKVLKPYDGDVKIEAKVYKLNGELAATGSFVVPLATVPETGIAFTQKEFTIEYGTSIPVGGANVTVTPAEATYKDVVEYKSGDASIAEVSENGVVTPLKNEDTSVKVYAFSKNGKSAEATVNIKKVDDTQADKGVTSISFKAKKITADVKDGQIDFEYLVEIEPEDPSQVSDKEKLWVKSSDDTVVTPFVGDDSRFYPALNIVGKGTATVTVYSWLDPTVKASIDIEITDKAAEACKSLTFVPDELTLYMDYYGSVWMWDGDDVEDKDYREIEGLSLVAGGTFDLSKYLKVEPADSTDEPIYTSSDIQKASVNASTGAVSVKKKGDVEITARSSIDEKVQTTKPFKLHIKKLEDEVYQEIKAITSPAAPTTAVVGDEINLNAYIKKTPSGDIDDDVIWVSSNPQTAYVYNGYVTALKAGKVDITAYSKMNYKEGKTVVKFSIEIKEAEAENITAITLVQDKFELTTGEVPAGFNLSDYIVTTPAKVTNDEIKIVSDAPGTVRVEKIPVVQNNAGADETEKIWVLYLFDKEGKDLTPGTATLTVFTKNGKAEKKTITVTHKKAEVKNAEFVGAPTKLQHKDKKVDLASYLVVSPTYYTASDFTWISDKPEYATVDEKGTVEYKKPGEKVTITIIPKDGGKSATWTFEVVDEPIRSIKVEPEKISLKVNETLALSNLTLVIEPENADEEYVESVELISSDPDVVYVGLDGDYKPALIARSVGTVTITAAATNAYDQVYGTFEVEVTENAISSIKFNKKAYTKKITNSDRTLYVYFTVKPYNATLTEKDFNIQSSDRNVAEVKYYGYDLASGQYKAIVTFNAPGTAKITVRSVDNEKVYGSTKVTADAVQVKKIKLPKKSMKLFYYFQGEQQPIMQNWYVIKPKIQPSNAWYSVTWETTNPGVAFVKEDLEGKKGIYVVATGAGTATITMNVDDGTNVRQAKMKIIVVAKTVDLKLNKKKATITMIKGKDNTVQLIAYDPVTEDAVPVRWSSSNKKVASVSKDGLVKALKAGEATITATTKDGNETTATCVVTVEKKLITSLKAKGTLKLAKKETKQLSIKIKPSDAYNTKLSFKSSDESVATVDANGLVKGIAKGEAIITVKTTDGSKLSLEIAVTVE